MGMEAGNLCQPSCPITKFPGGNHAVAAKPGLCSKRINMTRELVEDLAHEPISDPFRCKCQMAEPKFLTARLDQ